MKRLVIASLVIASSLRADTGSMLTQDQLEALTPIDALPTTNALDRSFPPDAVTMLLGIARSDDPQLDLGAQLRAIRSLPLYCPCDATHAPYTDLRSLLQEFPSAPTPRDVLRLRAEIEAFGAINSNGFDGDNYKYLTPFLSNGSRDIRAATAIALGKLCNKLAIFALNTRSTAEQAPGGSQQVVLAISTALRDLSFNCPGVQ